MINRDLLNKFEKRYKSDKKNAAIENAIHNAGIEESSIKQSVIRKHSFVFSDETEHGKITDQKQSRRCWIFSGLNMMRVDAMKNMNIENIEFSQSYLLFFDKIEKANTYLEYVIETKNKNIFDRLVRIILAPNILDDGYWSYFYGLAEKYGIVPKECMPETPDSSCTNDLNQVIELYMKKAAMDIRNSDTDEEARKIKKKCLYQVYNICCKALGKPPKKIDFEYRDKDGKYNKFSGMTPVEFMNKFCPNSLENKVELMCDPRDEYEKGIMYEIPYVHSVIENSPYRYINVTIDELKKAAIKSIKDGKPVWFGCDVGKESNIKMGILDRDLYDFDNTLTPVGDFSKEDRFLCGYSKVAHAMLLVGVDLDEDGNPIKWKIENSWGTENGKDGIYSMSDEWFNMHLFDIAVDKNYISDEYLEAFNKNIITLPYFDRLFL